MGQVSDSDNFDTSTNIRIAIERLNNLDYEGALNIASDLLADEELQKNHFTYAQALFISGICKLFLKHSIEEVISLLRKSAQISQEVDDLSIFCQATFTLGDLEAARGDRLQALRDYVACLQNLDVRKQPSAFVLGISDRVKVFLESFAPEEANYSLWIETVDRLGHLYLSVKPLMAINVALNALKFPLQQKDLYDIHKLAGLAYGTVGENRKSIEHLEFVLGNALESEKAWILGNLGRVYRLVGDTAKALDAFEKIESMRLKLVNKDSGLDFLHVNNLIELGAVHRDIGNVQQARVCFNKALELTAPFFESDIQAKFLRVFALTNLGLLDTDVQHFENALENQLAALMLLKGGDLINLQALAMVETNLALVFRNLGKFKEAAEHLHSLLEAQERLGNLPSQIETLNQLAQMEMQLDNPSKALSYLEQELGLLERLEGQGLRYGLNLLSIAQVSTKSRDENKAIWAFGGAVKIFESLGNIQWLTTALSAYAKFCESRGDNNSALELRHRLEKIQADAEKLEKSDTETLYNTLQQLQAGKPVQQSAVNEAIDRLAKNQRHFFLAYHTKSMLLRVEKKYDEAIDIIDKALSFLPQVGRDERKAFLLLNKGQLLIDTGLTEQQVIDTVNEAIENIPLVSDIEMRGDLWYRAGRFCLNLGDQPRTINYFQHAAEDFFRAGAFKKLADAQYQLGVVYSDLKVARGWWYLKSAEENYEKAGDSGNLLNCKFRFALALANFGLMDYSINKLIELVNLAGQQGKGQIVLTGFSLISAIAVQRKNTKLLEGVTQDLMRFILANRNSFANYPILELFEQIQSNPEDVDLEGMVDQFSALGINILPEELLNAEEDYTEEEIDKKMWEHMEKMVNNALQQRSISVQPRNSIDIKLGIDGPAKDDPMIKLWDMGLSEQKGWATNVLGATTVSSNSSPQFTIENNLEDLQKIKALVESYAKLKVWIDPNLGIIKPIIDTYIHGTRFFGKTLINPPLLTEDSLHIFFFNSDPLGMLGIYANACSYVSTGNVIFCSLPFLENLLDYVEVQGAWDKMHDLHIFTVRIDKSDMSEGGKGVEGKVIESTNNPSEDQKKLISKITNSYEKDFLLSWVIAHEIGHAVLGHSFDVLSSKATDQEEDADAFFIDHIQSPGRNWQDLYDILLKVYQRHHELEYGNPYLGEGIATTSSPIHIQNSAGNHPHFLIRLLDLGDRLIKRFPTVEEKGSEYLVAVRRNLIIKE